MNELHLYFSAERQAGVVAVVLGGLSLAAALYLWSSRSPFRAAAWPLIAIGVVELGLGGALIIRTPAQVRRLDAAFASSPQAAAGEESRRIARVNRAFRVIMAGELALIALGASLTFFLRSRNEMWSGIGMGLLLQASVLLVFDVIAERRAHAYSQWLSTW